MFVKGPDNALLNLTTATSSRLRAGWQTGQLLKAMVINTNSQGGATLEINGQRVQAQPQNQTHMPLKAGQSLQLEVMRIGESPVLKILNPAANQQEVVSRGVRQSLPQQQPLPQLLNALSQLAQSGKGDTAQQLKALSQQLLNQLPQLQQLKNGPAVKQALQDSGNFLEAKLKQMAQQGEAGKEGASLNKDLKAGVLRLLQLLRSMPQPQSNTTTPQGKPAGNSAAQPQTGTQQSPAQTLTARAGPPPAQTSQAAGQNNPSSLQTTAGRAGVSKSMPELAGKAAAYNSNQPPLPQAHGPAGSNTTTAASLMGSRPVAATQQQLESGLARIQFNQLQSLQQSEGQRPSWLLELPVRQPDGEITTLELEIQQDREEDEKSQKPAIWTISLSFELQSLGAIRAGLTLVGDNQVGVSLWANNSDTVELFEQHKQQLQQGMEKAGLQVSRVGCQLGLPKKSKSGAIFAEQGLVDEQA